MDNAFNGNITVVGRDCVQKTFVQINARRHGLSCKRYTPKVSGDIQAIIRLPLSPHIVILVKMVNSATEASKTSNEL